MSRIDEIRAMHRFLDRDITEIFKEHELAEAKRKEFMQSEAVKEHMAKHEQKHENAALIFSTLQEKQDQQSTGLDAIVKESMKKPKEEEEFEKEAQKQQVFKGYTSNNPAFGGYNAKKDAGEGMSYSVSGTAISALCSAPGCGCEFTQSSTGSISTKSSIPGHEASYNTGAGQGGTSQSYSTGSSSQAAYGTSSSSKVNYGK